MHQPSFNTDKTECLISLIGPFTITASNNSRLEISGKRSKALVALVALAKGRVRSRKWLQDKLWSDRDEQQGAASLRQELSNIRKFEAKHNLSILMTTRETVSLSDEMTTVDILQGVRAEEGQMILEGLDVGDHEFEEWLSLERSKWSHENDSLAHNRSVLATSLDETIFRKPCLVVLPFDVSGITQNRTTELYDELLTSLGALSGDIEIYETAPEIDQGSLMQLQVSLRYDKQVRTNLRIVRISDQKTIWSTRLLVDDLHSYANQTEVCRQILEGVQTAITDGHMSFVWSRYPTSLNCWDAYQRGRKEESLGNKSGHRRARNLYRSALRLDPNFVPARIVEAFVLIDEIRLGWSAHPEYDIGYVEKQYENVIQFAPNEPYAHIMKCYLLNLQKRFTDACERMDLILSEIPENPELLAYQALLLEANDEPARALALYRKALRLTAHPPNWIRVNLALAYVTNNFLLKAKPLLDEAISKNPESLRALIGLAVLSIRSSKKEETAELVGRIRTLQPDFDARTWRVPDYFKNPDEIIRISRELSSAGL